MPPEVHSSLASVSPEERPPHSSEDHRLCASAFHLGEQESSRLGWNAWIDPNEKLKLRRLRNELADNVFRYRAKKHETFGFHISLAYQMRGFTSEEKREYDGILERHLPMIENAATVIELGAPEFCTFEDMYRFEILRLLRT